MKVKNKTTGETKDVYGAARGEYYVQSANNGMILTEGPMFLVWSECWQWMPASYFIPAKEGDQR